VNGQIDKLFQDRLVEAFTLRGMTDTDVAESIYALTHTPERLQAAASLEEMYAGNQLLFTADSFKFKLNTGVTKRKFEAKLRSPKKMLHAFVYQYGDPPELTEAPEEVKQAINEADKRWHAVKDDKESFKEAFSVAWKKVKSVNELLKTWPAVSDLLPPDVITRINKKSGPRTKKEETFDAAALNVQLLKAKVAK
jgi:hypothetical protein